MSTLIKVDFKTAGKKREEAIKAHKKRQEKYTKISNIVVGCLLGYIAFGLLALLFVRIK